MAAFAHRLWALKRSAGDPSYDRMRTELGALASKSALSAAARGQRLPSWDTTWEFVRVLAVGVLGEHEDEVRARWRADWERVRDGVANPPPAPRRWKLPVAAAAVVLAIGVAAGVILLRDPDPEAPAALPPLVPGDESEFAGDVTVPDGTVVPTGARFVKTWEFRNTGTVPWVDRSLRREGGFGPGDGCQTPPVVPVPDTPPGQSARVSVEVRAPDEPGYCQVYFKMTDSAGRLLLPGTRAAYFYVRVTG
ncbi:NBR1-Ig-like domain-containing protein [Amycolatopsis tucumanensis]|uniref:NBR1-Ig-like domain-containing protein n=1 Tax=Amycolatopsis tucumanensis TaxID=401106 RepID=UPI003D708E29